MFAYWWWWFGGTGMPVVAVQITVAARDYTEPRYGVVDYGSARYGATDRGSVRYEAS